MNLKDLKKTFLSNILFVLPLLILIITIWLAVKYNELRFNKFEEVHELSNWDLDRSYLGDIDNDGRKDEITPYGCAILSSINEGNIPKEKQCRLGPPHISLQGTESQIGQKYINTSENVLSKDREDVIRLSYSYLAREKNKPWRIYAWQDGLTIYEIQKNVLVKIDASTFDDYLNFAYYRLTNLFIVGLILWPIPVMILVIIYITVNTIRMIIKNHKNRGKAS